MDTEIALLTLPAIAAAALGAGGAWYLWSARAASASSVVYARRIRRFGAYNIAAALGTGACAAAFAAGAHVAWVVAGPPALMLLLALEAHRIRQRYPRGCMGDRNWPGQEAGL